MSIRSCLVAATLATLCSAPLLRAQVPDLYDMNTVRDVYFTFSQPDYWTQLTNNYAPEINIAANMTVDGRTYPNVGVRFRGNTSYTQLPAGSQKKSFNVELDWMVQGQDIYGYDHLNFNNGFHDPTFLREPLTYLVMRRHGVAPKANWIRLWINGQYWGIYINAQQPNKDMMKEWFRSNDGNRYRGFPTSGTFGNGRCAYTWLGSVVSSYLTAYQAKQGDGIDLMNMCNVLNNTPVASLEALLPAVFSVDAFYRYAAVMNVTTTTDSYLQSGKDHYLYIDDVHRDGTTFPFDLNEAMAGSSTLDPWFQTTNIYRPGFTKTFPITHWRERYKAHLRHVIDHSFNPTFLAPIAQQYHAMIAADVAADTKKIYTTAQFTSNLTTSTLASGVNTPGLLPFITSRHAFLASHPDLSAPRATLTSLAHTPQFPNPTQPIDVTVQASSNAASLRLYWRRIGAFQPLPMFDDGLHGDGAAGDGTWGAQIPPQVPGALVDYYVEARTATGLASFLPLTAELEREARHVQIDWPVTTSPIVINEFVAQNVNGPVDEANQHEDWIELYNTSAAPVDVGGMWLSDSLVVLKYRIPPGNTIAPNGVLRIWADEDGTQGPLHANFKLSSAGEVVALYAADGLSLHESITFGPQAADVSTGRLTDGPSAWVTFPAPTYLARNTPAGCGQRTYGSLQPSGHGFDLALSGTLQVATSSTFTITGGPAGGFGVFAMAFGGDQVDLTPYGAPGDVLLLSPVTASVNASVPLDSTGYGALPLNIPAIPSLAGVTFYTQALGLGTAGIDTSRAIEARICP